MLLLPLLRFIHSKTQIVFVSEKLLWQNYKWCRWILIHLKRYHPLKYLPSMIFKYWVTCSNFSTLIISESVIHSLLASSECLLNPVQRAVSLKQYLWSVILRFILTSVKNGLALHWVLVINSALSRGSSVYFLLWLTFLFTVWCSLFFLL